MADGERELAQLAAADAAELAEQTAADTAVASPTGAQAQQAAADAAELAEQTAGDTAVASPTGAQAQQAAADAADLAEQTAADTAVASPTGARTQQAAADAAELAEQTAADTAVASPTGAQAAGEGLAPEPVPEVVMPEAAPGGAGERGAHVQQQELVGAPAAATSAGEAFCAIVGACPTCIEPQGAGVASMSLMVCHLGLSKPVTPLTSAFSSCCTPSQRIQAWQSESSQSL